MRPLILLTFALAIIPGLAWGPIQPYVAPFNPHSYVLAQARLYGVPPILAFAIWDRESGMATSVKDGAAGERGVFQVTEAAAIDVGCASRWRFMRPFRVSVNCGMRYLASSLKRCGTPLRAAHRYNHGHCPHRGKVWAYGQEVGRLMMKHSQGTE